ncbi:hypothetical protein ACLF6N_22045 (plasmid) [Bacillus subtilis]
MTKIQIEELRELYSELYTEAKERQDFNMAAKFKDDVAFLDFLINTYE